MDKIKFTILDDGTIKIETDKVSMPNHANAEAFLRDVQKLAGGESTSQRKGTGHAHTHQHEHGDHTHTH